MIPPEKEAEILRLFHAEHWRINTIATQLGLHHNTVRRVLARLGVQATRNSSRVSILTNFLPLIHETLQAYPDITASRIFEMARSRGYKGSEDHFRAAVARYRPRPTAEPFSRLRMLPGEQAQVDWGHFGSLTFGKAQRSLMAFVMVLSFSRKIFLRFYLGASMPMFLRGHVEAFAYFGGVPRELLYDNLKSAVLERHGSVFRFHPTLLELAGHYHFLPRPCRPRRGNEKGRVERAIRYVRDNFFAARTVATISQLNDEATEWCNTRASERPCPDEVGQTVGQVFLAERERLLPLPDNPFETIERLEVAIGKTPYARFDLNDYSVPSNLTRRTLLVLADLETVRLVEGTETCATHARSWSRGQRIEAPEHFRELAAQKRQAATHRAVDRLMCAVPQCRELLEKVAQQGGNLGNTISRLLSYVDTYGAVAVSDAVATALAQSASNVSAVRLVLEAARKQKGELPPMPVELPDDPKVRNVVVRPHGLGSYDTLFGK